MQDIVPGTSGRDGGGVSDGGGCGGGAVVEGRGAVVVGAGQSLLVG